MRPEISALLQRLTYPELKDASDALVRQNLRGIRDNVVFINHEKPDNDDTDVNEPREENAKASKWNQ